MNKIKLLSKLDAIFNSENAKKKKEIKNMQEVVEQLKGKQQKTQKMLKQCQDETLKKALNLELDVISAHIEKGECFLKENDE